MQHKYTVGCFCLRPTRMGWGGDSLIDWLLGLTLLFQRETETGRDRDKERHIDRGNIDRQTDRQRQYWQTDRESDKESWFLVDRQSLPEVLVERNPAIILTALAQNCSNGTLQTTVKQEVSTVTCASRIKTVKTERGAVREWRTRLYK